MRRLTDHLISTVKTVQVEVQDEPGLGGANYVYQCWLWRNNEWSKGTRIDFQNGPEVASGITDEVLLAIVADRLQAFSKGPYACKESARALDEVGSALCWLKARTINRIIRGVEGKMEK